MEAATPHDAMASLTTLPNELLHSVLCYANATDLDSVAATCHQLHDYIKDNALLSRDQYLKTFDPPQPDAVDAEVDWVAELRDVIRLERVLVSDKAEDRITHFASSAKTIIKLLQSANPALDCSPNRAFLLTHFQNPPKQMKLKWEPQSNLNIDGFLCGSSLFSRAEIHTSCLRFVRPTPEQQQLAAKLHVLFGVPVDVTCTDDMMFQQPTNPHARAKVYDLREYTTASMWGPFMGDGSGNVDWEKLEAIMIVIGHNFRAAEERHGGELMVPALPYAPMFDKPWSGVCPHSWVPDPKFAKFPMHPRKETAVTQLDPYNVTGTWLRAVCFLDYSDLHAFNFSGTPPPANEPRGPIETEEATRMIILTLITTAIDDAGPDDKPGTKVVQYAGRSRSLHNNWDVNANSNISGTVRTTREGEVRWTSFSIFQGEERWRSEGIQIGGPQSGRGVLGTWFDKDYEPEGPAGPTAYWKVSDKLRMPDTDLQEWFDSDSEISDDGDDGDNDDDIDD